MCALEQVTLQLKWRHQFQFAGYYAAQQQGYYRDAGLDVTIKPATPGKDPVLDVINGKAEYGVGTSSLLLLRNAGKPVVALAVIFQHSPYILLAKEFSVSQTIHSLAGKRLMLEPQADELVAYLKKEGIPLEKMQVSEHTFTITNLLNGTVDVMSGYVTDDPHELERAGFAYHAYTPRSAGIDFYGDNLFTTEDELKKHPERAKAFREASLKGWQYALQHPDKIIDLIISSYTPHADRSHLKYEAEQIRQLVQPDFVEIGYMHPGRWQHAADVYTGLGMLPKNVDVNPFLYDPYPHKDLRAFYRIAGVFLGLALLVMTVRLIITSRTLKWSEEHIRRQFDEISRINAELEQRVEERTEELRKSESQFRMLFDLLPVGVTLTDNSGQIIRTNSASEHLLGIPSDDITRRNYAGSYWAIVRPDGSLMPQDEYASVRAMKEQKRVENMDMGVIRPDGTVSWITVSAEPVVEPDIGVLIVYSDITERKQAEEELRQAKNEAVGANLAKSRFLAIVAHEFRTPLARLTMSVDIFDRYWERLSREECQDQYRQIHDAKELMARLIDSVLVFSRQEKTTYSEIPLLLDVAAVCRTAAEEIISVWGGEHSFSISIDPDCGRQLLIEILFQRVIANLLTNALRFTPPGGTIAFSVALQEHRLVIEVADSGIGIPEDEQPKVFEAFYRSSNVDARSGLGLGLSIVSEAVNLMNGTITLTSTVGVGTTFRVELPVEF